MVRITLSVTTQDTTSGDDGLSLKADLPLASNVLLRPPATEVSAEQGEVGKRRGRYVKSVQTLVLPDREL